MSLTFDIKIMLETVPLLILAAGHRNGYRSVGRMQLAAEVLALGVLSNSDLPQTRRDHRQPTLILKLFRRSAARVHGSQIIADLDLIETKSGCIR